MSDREERRQFDNAMRAASGRNSFTGELRSEQPRKAVDGFWRWINGIPESAQPGAQATQPTSGTLRFDERGYLIED